MTLIKKAIMNWSGGKDSALALHQIHEKGEYQIESLLTTVSAAHKRISMHGVREDLLDLQAQRLGLPVAKISIPEQVSMQQYDLIMTAELQKIKSSGINYSIFGDIFLEDLRAYREKKLSEVGLTGLFPLWKKSTPDLILEFLDLGFQTITVCVNDQFLGQEFVGRIIDRDFLKELPSNVDPCGENGEFHTFLFAGPIFSSPIHFSKGEVVHRTYQPSTQSSDDQYDCQVDASKKIPGFWYMDLIPAE